MENNMPQKKQLPAFLILGIIALVAAVVLAATNMLTRGPIEEHKMAALKDAFNAVMPADEYEEMTVPGDYNVRSLYAAKKDGEVIGYCVTAASMGYASDVAVTLGVGTDGIVTGASVGDTSFAETAGFGARAKEPAFQEQFAGLDAVNGGSFEALSGATLTSTAVLNATNAAFRCVTEFALQKTPAADPLVTFGAPAEKPKADKPALTGAVQEGKAQGFGSEVTVKLTVEDGAIAGIEVISDGETPGFGTRCGEDEAFLNQFIGKTAPLTLGENIDALSGATVTSTAVVEAANAALAAPASAGGEALTGTAQGFGSEVTVTLTVEGDAIASFMVTSDGETPGFGTRCGEDEAFLSQFIGKTAPLTLGENIDALSGATVTSTAVVEAANAALASAASAGEAPATVIAEDANAKLGVKADGTAVVTAAEGFNGTVDVTLTVKGGKTTAGTVASKKETTAEWDKNGQATATAKGVESKVRATLTLNPDGTIATLKLNTANETEYIGDGVGDNADFVNQFIGKTAPFTAGEGIDVVSRATLTSKAAIEAINLAAEFAATAEPAAAAEPEPVKDEYAAELDKDGKATAAAKGVESKVRATLMLNLDGTIAELKVNTANETEYIGDGVGENADFVNQFIGKAAPFTVGEGIDAVSGATMTSKAVAEAVNKAAIFAAENSVYAPEAEPAAEEPAATEEPAAIEEPAPAPVNGVVTGTAKGFQSDVTVRLAVKDGVITIIEVTSDGETSGFGTRCGEDKEFQSQFIGKSLPLTLGEDIDALSGATVTSTAVVEAANAAR